MELLKEYSRETTVGEILDSMDYSKYNGLYYKQFTEDIVFGNSLDVFYAENLNEEFTGTRIHFSGFGVWTDKGYRFKFNPKTAIKIDLMEFRKYEEKYLGLTKQIKKIIRGDFEPCKEEDATMSAELRIIDVGNKYVGGFDPYESESTGESKGVCFKVTKKDGKLIYEEIKNDTKRI